MATGVISGENKRIYKRIAVLTNITLTKNSFQWFDIDCPEVPGYRAAIITDWRFDGTNSAKLNIHTFFVDWNLNKFRVGIQNLDTANAITFSLYATAIYESNPTFSSDVDK